MKNNKGITLVSVLIYLIVLVIIIGIMSGLTRYFYRNSNDIVLNDDTSIQYSRLMDYLVEDINSGNVENISIEKRDSDILMNLFIADQTVHQYQYDSTNKRVVYITMDSSANVEKKMTICNRVDECNISKSNNKLSTKFEINGVEYVNDLYF